MLGGTSLKFEMDVGHKGSIGVGNKTRLASSLSAGVHDGDGESNNKAHRIRLNKSLADDTVLSLLPTPAPAPIPPTTRTCTPTSIPIPIPIPSPSLCTPAISSSPPPTPLPSANTPNDPRPRIYRSLRARPAATSISSPSVRSPDPAPNSISPPSPSPTPPMLTTRGALIIPFSDSARRFRSLSAPPPLPLALTLPIPAPNASPSSSGPSRASFRRNSALSPRRLAERSSTRTPVTGTVIGAASGPRIGMPIGVTGAGG
ncbi:hypothetical protein HETIRDRAFT_452751 [Heterobasidion irregulare TC 32-1]|uniref:Uncharacterized protein n=1 Tax=Heterobasidion irregulare (strain TC 32-1) TaxID=747525 RepID=W4K1N6_HETIT|nr:uncharacterized protein HETIRDRAFT_452751 [Heterobasidion irregulare TC 32-1]ETW79634.1 hypothetical protein HETIRDRAFT_452751 [Heterobasidion irregulare TC 32-1]